jgi:hypothetical protein
VALCALLVAIPLGLLIGSVILRAACSICQVREPDLLSGMGIVFVVGLVNALVLLPITVGVIAVLAASGANKDELQLAELGVRVLSLPIQAAISAGLYTAFLKVSFGKGLLIWLTQVLIALVAGLVIGGIAAVVLIGVAGLNR